MHFYNAMMKQAAKISFFWRIILCLIFPPLSVFDKGCFSVMLVYFLTLAGMGTGILFGMHLFSFLTGWIPAGLVALLICAADKKNEPSQEILEPDACTEKIPMQLTFRDILILGIRYLLCVITPPLAVLDKGCGAMLYVFMFTLCGWLPGTILAFLMCLKSNNYYRKQPVVLNEQDE